MLISFLPSKNWMPCLMREIDPASFEEDGSLHDATAAGRGYAVARRCCRSYRSMSERILSGCTGSHRTCRKSCRMQKVLALAKAGKLNGCMIEGMACPGGCMGGAGTNVPVAKSSKELKKFLASCSRNFHRRDLLTSNLTDIFPALLQEILLKIFCLYINTRDIIRYTF